jgi:hypothetical protein
MDSARLTSIPGSRDARRGETSSRFRPLKSLPCKSMNIWSMCHCSPTISPPGNLSATRTTVVLAMLSIASLAPSIAASAAPPPLNRDCGSLFEVRSAREKALSRKNIHFDLRNIHSGSFAGQWRGLPTLRGVFSAAWHALACLHHPVLNCIIFLRHHPFRLDDCGLRDDCGA